MVSESWFIKYIPEKDKVEIIPGSQLPVPLTNFAFAEVDKCIFVAGGISDFGGPSDRHFYCMDISGENPSDWKWELLPAWSGESRAFAVGAGQSNGVTNCFYLFSGRKVHPGKNPKVLYDAHVYNPYLKKWSIISDGDNRNFPVMAGTAFPVGAATIVFSSGTDGKMMRKQMEIENQIAEHEVAGDKPENIVVATDIF